MTINAAIQTLEPGALVELFILDASTINGGVNRFHAHTQTTSIWFQGQEYFPWPVSATGFARTGDKPPTPALSVGNVDGSISALCHFFEDMVGAKVIRKRTLGKFLDAANFPEGNAEADPTEEMAPEVWYIERKNSETSVQVDFELSSAMDFNGVQLPRRQIIANMCPSKYRGAECGYTGGPVAEVDDTPTTDNAKDRCGKRLSSCRMRFGADSELPFGGFPAAGLMRS